MSRKIKKDDEIIVLTGKEKGKIGKVKLIINNKKAIVEGINLVKKHEKPVPSTNKIGGIIEKEKEIDISNVAIFNPITNKADRIKFIIKNSKKMRIYKSNGKIIK